MKFTDQESGVNAVRFSPTGEAVVAGGSDGTVSEQWPYLHQGSNPDSSFFLVINCIPIHLWMWVESYLD